MTSTNITATAVDTTDDILDGIVTVTASTIAVQAVLDLIGAEADAEAAIQAEVAAKAAHKAAKADVKAAAERVDDRLEAACPQIITALAVKGVSQRSLAADLRSAGATGWSKDRIAMAVAVGTALALPGDVRGGALRTAWDSANRAKGVGRAAIDAVLTSGETREDVLRGWEALVGGEVIDGEDLDGEGEVIDGEGEGRTPWQERLAALVAQAIVEGADPDEIREVVEAAL